MLNRPPILIVSTRRVRGFGWTLSVLMSLIAFGVCDNSRLFAELPSIRLDTLLPLGASAGTTVSLTVVGADLEEARGLMFDHPGFQAEFVEDRKFNVTIAADVPQGTYDVRLIGKYGVSNPRLFSVTHGLTDVADTDPNNQPQQPQSVAVNSAIDGQSDGNGEDWYKFPAKKGQRIVIECQAGSLDSMLDGELKLTTTDGTVLATNGDYYGRDPLIDFVADADREYLVEVHDLSYRGGIAYRLIITDRPHVENVFPRAVTAGQSVELNFYGRNLASDPATAATAPATSIELPLEERRISCAIPLLAIQEGSFDFFEHPTAHTVLPTAATCTLTGMQLRPDLNLDWLHPPIVYVTDQTVTIEQEPNDRSDQSQTVAIPLVVSGRMDKPRDADWYEFEVPKAANYLLQVYSERIAGRADPYCVVVDDKGNRLVEHDDYGHRINAFDGHLRDPIGTVSLQPNQKYRVMVQDRYGRGGSRFQYVLTVKEQQFDYFVAAMHHQNPGPGGTNIWRGGTAYWDIVVHQPHMTNEPVTLTADNLPPGIHAVPTTIWGNGGTFVVWSDPDAPAWTGPLQLTATARFGDQEFKHKVRPYCRVSTDPGFGSSRPMRSFAVSVVEPAPFSLQFVPDRIEIVAGQSAEVKLQLQRIWPDFGNALTIQPVLFPGHIRMQNAEIPAGGNEAALKFEVQNGARPGEYTVAVSGQGQVPFNKDAQAKDKPNTLVTQASRPLTIVVKAP